jgi:aspartate racemase
MNQRGLTVGVLGGMGPDATIDFMSDVLRLTDAEKDQDHIHLVVDQNPAVPNRQQAIRSGTEEVGLALASMARRLEAAGADFLVMPCNTAHAFEASIRAATNRPFISIIEVSIAAVGKLLAADGHVGIMATDGLMDTGIYQRALSAAGFPSLLPQTPQQGDLMGLIHRIKAGDRLRLRARRQCRCCRLGNGGPNFIRRAAGGGGVDAGAEGGNGTYRQAWGIV